MMLSVIDKYDQNYCLSSRIMYQHNNGNTYKLRDCHKLLYTVDFLIIKIYIAETITTVLIQAFLIFTSALSVVCTVKNSKSTSYFIDSTLHLGQKVTNRVCTLFQKQISRTFPGFRLIFQGL